MNHMWPKCTYLNGCSLTKFSLKGLATAALKVSCSISNLSQDAEGKKEAATHHQKMTEISQVLKSRNRCSPSLAPHKFCCLQSHTSLEGPASSPEPAADHTTLCADTALCSFVELHRCSVSTTPNYTATFKNTFLCPFLNTVLGGKKKKKNEDCLFHFLSFLFWHFLIHRQQTLK